MATAHIKRLTASAASDAPARLGIPGGVLGLNPLKPSQQMRGNSHTARHALADMALPANAAIPMIKVEWLRRAFRRRWTRGVRSNG